MDEEEEGIDVEDENLKKARILVSLDLSEVPIATLVDSVSCWTMGMA